MCVLDQLQQYLLADIAGKYRSISLNHYLHNQLYKAERDILKLD